MAAPWSAPVGCRSGHEGPLGVDNDVQSAVLRRAEWRVALSALAPPEMGADASPPLIAGRRRNLARRERLRHQIRVAQLPSPAPAQPAFFQPVPAAVSHRLLDTTQLP